jgi:hypothetical protein
MVRRPSLVGLLGFVLSITGCAAGGGGTGGSVDNIGAGPVVTPAARQPPPTMALLAPVQTSTPSSPITGAGTTVVPLLITAVGGDFGGDETTTSQGATLGIDSGSGRQSLTINNSALAVVNVTATSAPQKPVAGITGVQVFTGPVQLDYTRYGTWIATVSSDFGSRAAWLGGYETPVADVPASGTAVYRGSVAGLYSEYHLCACYWTTALLSGDVQISADFSARTLSGAMTNLRLGSDTYVTGPVNDIGFDAAIGTSGTRFSGTTRVTSQPGGVSALQPNATGVVSGQFFGPSAQELGAVWTLSDDTRRIIGSFGARQ